MIRTVLKIGNSLFVSLEKKEADYKKIKPGNKVHLIVTKLADEPEN